MGKVDALTGNECVAEAIRLCKPDLIAAYPITPQSSVAEKIAAMVANGELESTVCDVESEHSAMSILKGAAMVGKRVFTATAGQGLALMYEPYFSMGTMRIPMVMALACREMISPVTVWSGLQDALSVRDCGWMQVFCETNQEILDMIIQGYKISEDKDVCIPINVCYDGFYLSHQTQRVEIPEQDTVSAYLPPYSYQQLLDVKNPRVVDPNTTGRLMMEYREDHVAGMKAALDVIEAANADFAKRFGRDWGGAVDTYRMGDAETVLVTIGCMTGTAREVVDMMRAKGHKLGLVKIRFVRPFPDKKVAELLKGRKAVGVVDKSVCFGRRKGIVYEEVMAALAEHGVTLPSVAFIAGLGGYDIRTEHLIYAAQTIQERASAGKSLEDVIFLLDQGC